MSRSSSDLGPAWEGLPRRLRTALRPELLFLSSCAGDAPRLVSEFDAWCARHRGAVCDLALSAQWVRAIVPPPAAGHMTVTELRRYADRQLAHYFGDSRGQHEAGWSLAVSDDARVPLVLALPRSMLVALQEAATRHQVRIRRVVPWWLRACVARAGASHTVRAEEPELATIIEIADGRLRLVAIDLDLDPAAVQRTATAKPSDVQIVRLWSGPELLPPVCGDRRVTRIIASGFPQRSLPELDLRATRVRPSKASWGALLAAAAVAVVCAHRRDELTDRRADAQVAWIRAQASLPRAVHLGAVPSASSSRENAGSADANSIDANADTGALQAAVDMLALRHHPWAGLFAGLDAASPPGAMLELTHDARQRAVELSLLVPDDESAWSFAERLASDSSRFVEASLVTRERLDPPNGSLTTRARLRAVLAGDAQGDEGRAP